MWDGAGSMDADPVLAECGAAPRPRPHRSGGEWRTLPVAEARHPLPPESVRRIEVHAVVDGDGTAWAVGLCEEMDADGVGATRTRAGSEPAGRRPGASSPERSAPGACSVMFLVESDGSWSMVGVRPGLGAEHAITEMTTGVDLVKLQLHVADAGRLDGSPRNRGAMQSPRASAR